MATRYSFPAIKPSSRSYTPGKFPQSVFEAQNGTKTVIRFGNKAVNSQLSLSFDHITNAEAEQIMKNYEDVNSSWGYIVFTNGNAIAGVIDPDLSTRMRELDSGLRYRYSEPPTVQSSVPGRSSVTCKFEAVFDSP